LQERPNTTALPNQFGHAPARPFTGVDSKGFPGISCPSALNILGGRAISANYAFQNPKLRRYENVIYRLKKVLEGEKKGLRQIKTLCAKEID